MIETVKYFFILLIFTPQAINSLSKNVGNASCDKQKKKHSSLDMMWATENRAYVTNLDDISAATSGCLG